MTDAIPEPPSAATVLLIDDEAFERDYVQDVLATHGIRVVGPCDTPHEALAIIAAKRPDAAVVAWSGDPDAGLRLRDELSRLAIPHLTLERHAVRRQAEGGARLERPFAAYQVAQWVSAVIATRGDEPPPAPAMIDNIEI